MPTGIRKTRCGSGNLIYVRTKPCIYCGTQTDHIMSEPTPGGGRHSTAVCEDCMVEQLNMPEEARWSNRQPGGYLMQPCPECGAPEGLFVSTEMIEHKSGLCRCPSCGAAVRPFG